MALIPCPECNREISTSAESCPQCGYPMRNKAAAGGPTCYQCSTPATTRCQSCGAMSCAEHLQSIYVPHGKGGAYELRCASCYSSAQAWKIVGFTFGAVVLAIVLIILSQMIR